ncbi:MAG: hypothetical protein HW400_937 [Candidatus Levybacteria bacterium]|nr:hypothetical protein [Candidatus Levybacteria bacterium]
MGEDELVFEKKEQGEPALVIKLKDKKDLSDPRITNILMDVGISIETFTQLLNMPVKGTSKETFNSRGVKIEDVVQEIINTPMGKAEIADVMLYKNAVAGQDDMALHLKVGQTKGFEAIYVEEGEALLGFPKTVDPVAPGVYAASKQRDEILLTPGTLAIIPAPTANGWSKTGEGFKFRYICQPPWNSTFVKPAIDAV